MNDTQGKGRRVLGRGLSALIPGAAETVAEAVGSRDYFSCPIDRVHPQPGQPRQQITSQSLLGLVESIREQGVIQPVIVRRRDNRDGYELIAGERRWRAAQMAGLKEIPVLVKEASTLEAFELALVENLQRQDLNPIEEAEAFQRLIDEFQYTQAEVAAKIGRDRSTVANSLRLIGLPPEVRSLVVEGRLTEGHARAILQVTDRAKAIALARTAASQGLSVRETEQRARAESRRTKGSASHAEPGQSPEARALVQRLQRALGAKVLLRDRRGKGRIEIAYTSYEELDRILDKIFK